MCPHYNIWVRAEWCRFALGCVFQGWRGSTCPLLGNFTWAPWGLKPEYMYAVDVSEIWQHVKPASVPSRFPSDNYKNQPNGYLDQWFHNGVHARRWTACFPWSVYATANGASIPEQPQSCISRRVISSSARRLRYRRGCTLPLPLLLTPHPLLSVSFLP